MENWRIGELENCSNNPAKGQANSSKTAYFSSTNGNVSISSSHWILIIKILITIFEIRSAGISLHKTKGGISLTH
jgi:hypothetical protein